MGLVMGIADRVHVLDFGRLIASGTPAEVQGDQAVIEAYLEPSMPEALLELQDVEARYGPVKALHGISLTVDEGEVVAVLGANGAGKTTTLRAICGMVRRSGEIVLAGKRISRRSPEAVARLGVAHVPEGRGTFDRADACARTCGSAPTCGATAPRSRGRLQRVLTLLPLARASARASAPERSAAASSRCSRSLVR